MARDTRRLEINVEEIVRLVSRDGAIRDKIVSRLGSHSLDDLVLSCLEKCIEDNKTEAKNWEQRNLLATFEGKANSYIAMSKTMVRKAKEKERRYREVRKMFIKTLEDKL